MRDSVRINGRNSRNYKKQNNRRSDRYYQYDDQYDNQIDDQIDDQLDNAYSAGYQESGYYEPGYYEPGYYESGYYEPDDQSEYTASVKKPGQRSASRIANRRRAKKSLLLVLLAVVFIAGIAGMRAVSLHEQSEELAITERQLQAQIDDARSEAEALASREKYMQTKKYIEDEAKNKLGLVYPDEIVIRPNQDN